VAIGTDELRRKGPAVVAAAQVLSAPLLLSRLALIEYDWVIHNSRQVANTMRQGYRLPTLPDMRPVDVTI